MIDNGQKLIPVNEFRLGRFTMNYNPFAKLEMVRTAHPTFGAGRK